MALQHLDGVANDLDCIVWLSACRAFLVPRLLNRDIRVVVGVVIWIVVDIVLLFVGKVAVAVTEPLSTIHPYRGFGEARPVEELFHLLEGCRMILQNDIGDRPNGAMALAAPRQCRCRQTKQPK